MDSTTGRLGSSGCGRRVSLKRRTSAASEASRNHSETRSAFLLLELGVDRRQLAKALAFANVDDHGDFRGVVFGLQSEFVEFADESNRKVIDAEVAAVFKGPEEGSLSGTAQTCDDDEGRRFHASGSTISLVPLWRFREVVFSLDRRICFSILSRTAAMDVYMSVETSSP